MTAATPQVRRSHDKMIAGVCGGLAERLGWSPSRFRLAYVILSICSVAFPGILVYAVLWFVMPAPEGLRHDPD